MAASEKAALLRRAPPVRGSRRSLPAVGSGASAARRMWSPTSQKAVARPLEAARLSRELGVSCRGSALVPRGFTRNRAALADRPRAGTKSRLTSKCRCLVRDRRSQFQLQSNARQDAAGTVAQRNRMKIAVLEQLARPLKRFKLRTCVLPARNDPDLPRPTGRRNPRNRGLSDRHPPGARGHFSSQFSWVSTASARTSRKQLSPLGKMRTTWVRRLISSFRRADIPRLHSASSTRSPILFVVPAMIVVWQNLRKKRWWWIR